MANNRGKQKMTTSGTIYALAIVLFSTTLLSPTLVHCQDFEDLNKQQQQQSTNTFPASFSRQPQSASSNGLSSNAAGSRQRPLLSNRFSPGSANSQQQLVAQPTNSVASFAPQPPQSIGGASNIEQMMKNALARTTQLNQAAAAVAAEPRLDSGPPAVEQQQQQRTPQQQQQQQPASGSSASPAATAQASSRSLLALDKQAEASDFQGATSLGAADSTLADNDNDNKQTTAPANGSPDPANGHETVYGDQRFANLFARRNNARKAARFQPSEPLKAKPTLPSFIKSPPDPKQFSAAAAQAFNDGVPGTRGTASQASLAAASNSQRQLQQQQQQLQQNRANLLVSQQKGKAAAITSNSAAIAIANSKRANATGSRATPVPSAPVGPKVAASNTKPLVASKPLASASSNNPFGRAQANSQDPASVIAMARKRLLANNALESAKLKQQQQAAKPAAN